MRLNYTDKGDGAPEAETFVGLNLKIGFWSQKVFFSHKEYEALTVSDVCQQTFEELVSATISPTISSDAKLNSGLEHKPLQSRS